MMPDHGARPRTGNQAVNGLLAPPATGRQGDGRTGVPTGNGRTGGEPGQGAYTAAAGDDRGGPRPAPVSHRWTDRKDDPGDGFTAESSALCRWRGGRVDRLAAFYRGIVSDVQASPDGRWLAVVVVRDLVGQNGLYAYSLRSGKLYQVDDQTTSCCFAGPARLAFIRAMGSTDQLVTVTLDESADTLAKTVLATLLHGEAAPLRRADGGLLVVTTAATFPAPASATTDRGLYRIDTASGRLTAVARDLPTGEVSPSPDGRRAMFVQRAADPGAGSSLVVVDVDGSHRRSVMRLPDGPVRVAPSWHGNDRVTLAAATGVPLPAAAGGSGRTAFDVVDCALPPAGGPLRPAVVLSRDWPADLKPTTEGGPTTVAPEPAPPAGPLMPAVPAPRR